MGNITIEVGDLRDLITEEIGCKAGLLLTDREAREVLRRAQHSEAGLFAGKRKRMVRMRPEEIDNVIVHLRYRIGDLSDSLPPAAGRIRWLVTMHEQGIDLSPIYAAFKAVVESKKYTIIGEEAAEEMIQLSQMPEILVYEFLHHTANQMNRSVSWFQARTVDLSWAIPLRCVFESETIPDDPELYLDQRYIDYFVLNGEDLARMHWRNFERLTAEFFKRKGFEVQLGPGTKDGGIDVRIWPANSEKCGPPLMLIQCKRYKATNDVAIETVKAFWTDVIYEGAQHGLIATTSRIAPDGIKTSRARKWPLGFMENKQVSRWVKTMWRHSPISTD
jgi:restriction system protein